MLRSKQLSGSMYYARSRRKNTTVHVHALLLFALLTLDTPRLGFAASRRRIRTERIRREHASAEGADSPPDEECPTAKSQDHEHLLCGLSIGALQPTALQR
eukprot:3430554-Pyramimonas_sp.AAC.1